jgi:tetratricopeptide (TPR) repeat protein
MARLDGSLAAVVCPNPFARMEQLRGTKCIGMQYSMAKDRYVNGPWRAMFDLTLTYGRYSAERISHFCPTAMVGNPRFHRWFADNRPSSADQLGVSLDRSRPTLLYLPTWGEFSSIDIFMKAVIGLSNDYNVLIKVHHKTETHEAERKEALASQRTVHYFGAMDDLLPLLDAADVVMSDYSGAIFDAIYVRKPIVLLQSDPATVIGKKFGFESIEYSRRDEIGPVVSSPDELETTLASVVSGDVDFRPSNERLRSEVFEYDCGTGAIAAKAIEEYVSDSPVRPIHQIYLCDELKADRLRRRKEKEQLKRWKKEASALREEINKAYLVSSTPSTIAEVARDPSRGELLYLEGVSYEVDQQWKAAAEKYRSALDCDGTRAEWHARLGFVLEQEAQWEDAVAAFEAALRLVTLSKL